MIPMPPENIRRISVFGLGHRFLSGTRNSHFSRPVTLRENAGLLTVTIRFDSHKLMPDFSGPHRGASSTPRCVFIPSSASCRSSVPVYSRSTAPTLLKPFSKHSSKAGKTKKEGVCARREAVVVLSCSRDVGCNLSPTCPFQTIHPAICFLLASLYWLVVGPLSA